MVVEGVIDSLGRKRSRWTIAGRFRDPEGGPLESPVLLSVDGMTLSAASGTLDPSGNLLFRFVLVDRLSPVLALSSDLTVSCGGVRATWSPEARAARAGITEDAARLDEIMHQIDDGQRLTSKGRLSPPLGERGPGIQALLAHYRRCDEILHEITGYNIHVVGGTLLGLEREGGPIAHDFDFDGAYLSHHSDPAAVREEWRDLLTKLSARGEDLKIVSATGYIRRNYVMWRAKGRPTERGRPLQIDLFPAFIDAEGFYCRPTFVRIPGGAEMILPLSRRPFAGGEVWAPNRAEEKLVRIFGDRWRTLDPFWTKPRFPGARGTIAKIELTDDEIAEIERVRPRSWRDLRTRIMDRLRAIGRRAP